MHTEEFTMEMFSGLTDCYLEKEKTINKSLEVNSATAKLDWVRSQIIGENVEFVTPFGKRCLTYADHTASGRSLQFVENFIMEKVLPFYGNTHTEDSFVGSMTGNIMAEAQKYVKACLGGTEDDALLFCGAGSTAAIKRLQEVMGIGVPYILREHILAALADEHRWVVFVGPYEHHSNLLSWRQSLAEVVEIPLSDTGLVSISSLRAALESPRYKGRPKLGSFSACSNVTGILSGTRMIARLLHAHGAYACFDFAACAPYVKIDMRSGQEDGYDAVFVSPHKFMGGPGTSGLLLMNKDLYLLKGSPPSTCGGGTVDFVNFDEEKTIYYDEIEHREDAGTPPIVQKIRTALVFCIKEFLTPELIFARESFFIEKAMSRLGANPSIDIYGPTTVKRIAILSFGIRPRLDRRPAEAESQSDNDDFQQNRPESEFDHSSEHEQPQLQWKPRISRENSPEHPVPKEEGTNIGSLNGLKKSAVVQERPPLRLQLDSDPKNPTGESVATEQSQGKPFSGRFIVKLLNDLFGIQARGGCSCAATYGHNLLKVDTDQSLAFREEIQKGYGAVKPGWARISFGYYISHAEFDFILSAVEFIAEYGARFLQLYDLNWRSGDWTFKKDNPDIGAIIADTEKMSFGETPELSGPAFFVSSTRAKSPSVPRFGVGVVCYPLEWIFSSGFRGRKKSPSVVTEECKSRLMATHLKMAKRLADSLPESGPRRQIPGDIDPATLTFLT